MRLSDQIEGLISNFERVVDGFLAGLPYERLVPAIQKTNTTIDVPIADLGLTSEGPDARSGTRSVDLLIAGSGGGGMVAGAGRARRRTRAAGRRKAGAGRRVDGDVRRHGVAAQQPADARRRRRRLARGRAGLLRRRRRRHRRRRRRPARREMFLTAGYEMIKFLLRKGVRLVRCPGWSDYYPNHKGGNAAGRAVEGIPFDAAELGDWSDKVQPSMAKNYGFVVLTNELRSVQYFNRSPRAFAVAMRVFLRTSRGPAPARRAADQRRVADRADAQGADRLGDGEPPLWTNAAMEDLIVEDGRVVGARIIRNGSSLNIEARKGVLLAAGGFGHNADMRRRYSGDQPNEAQVVDRQRRRHRRGAADRDAPRRARPTCWTRPGGCQWFSSPTGPRRRVARLGAAAARRDLCRLDRASGSATSRTPTSRSARRCTPTRRCRAGDLRRGLRRAATCRAPTRSRRSALPEELIEQGAVKRADTIADLARQIDVPADALEQTVKRFNGFAAKGLDPDFGRGQSAYNDCLGDPGYKPNAALGPLDRAPYYATRVLPGRRRDVRRRDHQRARTGARRARPGDRRPVRDRQHHRDGDGPHLSRRRRAASPTRWSSATSLPGTPPGVRVPVSEAAEPACPPSVQPAARSAASVRPPHARR